MFKRAFLSSDTALWLSTFTASQNQTWDGLCLSQPINITKRQLIKKCKASLLDFRNYLFSRQCALTFLLQQPWEVAQRSIPFMHNCMNELKILNVSQKLLYTVLFQNYLYYVTQHLFLCYAFSTNNNTDA